MGSICFKSGSDGQAPMRDPLLDGAAEESADADDQYILAHQSAPSAGKTMEIVKTVATLKTRTHRVGSKRYTLHQKVMKSLGNYGGNMSAIVQLPPGELLDEWIAVHCVDLFNDVMSAGPKYTYLWADGVHFVQATRVSASEYAALLTDWVDSKLADERLFPQDDGPYPHSFVKQVKPIFKRMFRLYAHLYHSHFRQFVAVDAEAHLNTCFKRYLFFVLEFHLVDERELAPLQQLIDNLVEKEKLQNGGGNSRPSRVQSAGS